jgi:phasin family protein
MTQVAEQFLASAKSAVSDLGEMAAKNMAAFEKLVELNMATAKSAVADSAEQMQAAFAARTPQDLTSAADLVKPMADKAAAYGKAVAGIVTEAGAALTKSAEGKFADLQAQALANIDAAMKHAPAGSETAVAAFKSALTASQNAFETAQASAKTAVATVEKNFAAATEMATKATKSASKGK